jgi:hypothetical protein
VRSVCSRLRLWRGRWMVIAHFLGKMKRLRCRKRRASDVPGWRGVESKGKCSQFEIALETYICIDILSSECARSGNFR